MIATTDFFPPVVDDPYAFGAIAAANALSDIYAMGGEPLFAINLVAFPDNLDPGILTEILRGGAEIVRSAGAVIAGGHTVTDREPKYGLAVTGIVHPDRILKKGGAQPGDRLILTKPLGSGVITTALKQAQAQQAHVDEAITSMIRLNREAARLARRYPVHAMTDITGYSLLGHGHELAQASGADLHLEHNAIRYLSGAAEYARADIFAGGMWRNREYFAQWVTFYDTLEDWQQYLLFDPQTSGGLLMAVDPAQADALLRDLQAVGDAAVMIGTVRAGNGRIMVGP